MSSPYRTNNDAYLGTVLVTGGCGFIGSFITEAFAAEPACSRVVVASRNPDKHRIDKASYYRCDLTDSNQVKILLSEVQPHVIVHTVSPGAFAIVREHYRVTYSVTKQLLELAKDHPSVKAFVWTSSANVVRLDPKVHRHPVHEEEIRVNDWTSPVSAYSRAKGVTETFVLGANTDATTINLFEDVDWRGKLLTTSLRICGLYGPRDQMTIPPMLAMVNNVATRFQVGPNKVLHSWCYAASAANAHVDAAKALLDGKHLRPDFRVDGEAFFIADPDIMKLWDFSRTVQKLAGDEFCNRPKEQQKLIIIPFWIIMTVAWISEWVYWVFTFGTKRPAMTVDHFEAMSRGYGFSIEKAKKRLGYKPVCTTEEGIRRTVKWFQENEAILNS